MHLRALDAEAVARLDIASAVPMVYRFDASLRPWWAGSRYLDPVAAVDPVRTGPPRA
jgi:bisphosphoglycerate-dependent phosphoglycerate mutase